MNSKQVYPDFYFGIDIAHNDIDKIKKVINKVSNYTNFFLIGSFGISHYKKEFFELCQILSENDLYFVVYDETPRYLRLQEATQIFWGEHYLGLEYEDEIGGYQLDRGEWRIVMEAEDAQDASNKFIEGVKAYINSWFNPLIIRTQFPIPSNFKLFTADYALYWFVYRSEYDVVLAEFGWNYSRQLNIALCRGAATALNKEWGVIITWTYNNPPYIESGMELYDDLVLAYENGAKYIIVYDTNEDWTSGILKEEHFEAMEKFWQYTIDNPRENNNNYERVAYVLPKNYAFGFRGPNDKIWGIWEANEFSYDLSVDLYNKMEKYGDKLDIIYDDEIEYNDIYTQYIFWNETIKLD